MMLVFAGMFLENLGGAGRFGGCCLCPGVMDICVALERGGV